MSDTGWIIAYTVSGVALAVAVFAAFYARLTRPHPGAHAASKPARARRIPAPVHRLGGVIGSLIERDPGPKRAVTTLLEDAPSGAGPAVDDAAAGDAACETEPAADAQDDPREPVFIPAATGEKPADPELPADLPERIEALESFKPEEDDGAYYEAVARLTSTRTGREQTAEWDGDDMTAVIGATERDPALAAAIPVAEAYYAEKAAEAERSQRFEDAHREEVEAAGDTTEQDRRSYYEANR